ncbi:hypothetical protein MCOR25_003486 [Pyricularia grisea]|nr:hypothetical protein MCOR25_003486 [Pyricularia grisea]
MAALSDRIYFPPLDECISGEKRLLSWRLVASSLTDTDTSRLTSNAVSGFLKDPYVATLFRDPSRTFAPPSPQTKSDFETKTSPINATTPADDSCDLQTIKSDALWLSKNAAINETAALRIVVAEAQCRPESHLNGPLSSQDVANIKDIVGQNAAPGASVLSAIAAASPDDAETIWTDFQGENARRTRILHTYLAERRHFAVAAASTAAQVLSGEDPSDQSDRDAILSAGPTWLSYLTSCIKRSLAGLDATLEGDKYKTDNLTIDWGRTCLVEAAHVMMLIFQITDATSSRTFAAPSFVAEWFTFITDYGFLDALSPADASVGELALPLKCLVCAITMSLLNLPRSMALLDQDLELGVDENSYIQDADILLQVHGTMQIAAENGLYTAAPAVFSWSLLLHRMYVAYQERAERRDLAQNQRAQAGFELEHHPVGATGRRNSTGSIVSIEARSYDQFLVNTSMSQDIQVAEALAQSATAQGFVYDVLSEFSQCSGANPEAALPRDVGAKIRCYFLELLKFSFPLVGYQSEPVTTLLAVLSAGDSDQERQVRSGDLPKPEPPVEAVLEDPMLLDAYVLQAFNRYPYEYAPFTTLCKLLAARVGEEESSGAILKYLLKTPTLTFVLPENFQEYQLILEEENSNAIQILQEVPLIEPSPTSWRRQEPDDEPFDIPAGSQGRFITDSGRVVLMEYEHSSLALMGKRLEVYSSPESYRSVLGPLQPQEAADAVSLLNVLIQREMASHGSASGLAILQETSRSVGRTKDVVSIVCDILDHSIQGEKVSNDSSVMALLTACVRFLDTVLPLCPGRVWSYMARCELLNTESRAGRLSRILGNPDLNNDRFDFLHTVIVFLSELVENAMQSSVRRKVTIAKPGALQKHGTVSLWQGTSDKLLTQVAVSIAQTAVDIFENSSTWRYVSDLHPSIIVRDLVPVLNKMLVYTYSVGEEKERLTDCLAPAAGYVLECFLSSSSAALKFQPLLGTFLSARLLPEPTRLYQKASQTLASTTVTVLEFVTSLIKTAAFLEKPSTLMETQLFRSTPLLARLCGVGNAFRTPVTSLMESLVASAEGSAKSEPPSLLGYLGSQIARSLLKLLAQLDKPFDRTVESARLWSFLSTILRSRQPWMANCLLTGNVPRDAVRGEGKSGKSSKLSPTSVLVAARIRLQHISSIPSAEALAILEFFTVAQNHWPWTIFATRGDGDHLQHLRKYVRDLKPASLTAKTNPEEAANQARIAAYIAEMFAMHLYHLRQMGQDMAFATELLQDLDYFLRDGVQLSGYNASLHANFTKNFASRYSGISLGSFKRTTFAPRELGKQFYYALDLAERMLDFDPGWVGPRDTGFRSEMETANLNLSLVDGQIALFHAWEFLLLELSVCLLPKNQSIAVMMAQVAEQCTEASHAPKGPEKIFVSLSRAQANLALTLIQRLADATPSPKSSSKMVGILWTALSSVEDRFGPDQIEYYRTLLKILYIVLRGCRQMEPSVSTVQTILNILDRIVAQGFRALVTLIHDPETKVAPADVALLTAILQACLAIPSVDECGTQILNMMASQDVLHVAMSLFSWADRLAEDGDPIYGELSLLFLLELSTVPAVAEQLALDGLLGHLTSARLANSMRRPNVSPFANTAGAQRCYSIWTKAVLPLMINILSALGSTIAPEVAFVLSWFSGLLDASVQRWEAPGLSRTSTRGAPRHVTLLAVSEIHSLALLTKVLEALRQNNNRDIAEVQWDGSTLLENIEFWLSRPKLLRESLVPLGSREVEWRATKVVGPDADKVESKLEEKVVSLMESVKTILSDEMD